MPPGKVHASRRRDQLDGTVIAAERAERLPVGPRERAGAAMRELIPAALAGLAPFYIADRAGTVRYANAAYLSLPQKLLGTAAATPPPPSLLPLADIVAAIDA